MHYWLSLDQDCHRLCVKNGHRFAFKTVSRLGQGRTGIGQCHRLSLAFQSLRRFQEVERRTWLLQIFQALSSCCNFYLTLFKLMQLFSSFFNLLQLFQTFSSCCSWDWIKKNSYALLCGNIHKCEISLIWLQETKAFEMKSNDVSRSKFNQMIQLVLVGGIHRYFMHFCSYCKPAQRNTWPTL